MTSWKLRAPLFSKADKKLHTRMERAVALREICVEHAKTALRNNTQEASMEDVAVSSCHFPLEDIKTGNMSKESRFLYNKLAVYAREKKLI